MSMEQAGTKELSMANSPSSDSNSINTHQSPRNGLAKGAFVCGIIAVSFNLLAITAVFGFFLGIVSIVLGAISSQQSVYGKAGFVLGLLSMFVIAAYVISTVTIMIADPFI